MRRFSLAILFYLFLTGIANAECAWVLWEREEWISFQEKAPAKTPTQTVTWEITGAVPDFNKCIQILIKVHEEQKKKWTQTKNETPNSVRKVDTTSSSVTVFFKDSVFTTEYKCLPDTIDPRK